MDSVDKWIWKMDYCFKMGFSPAQEWAWIKADNEFNRR